uniref:Uncharacterized protein n=1 Tax=Magallana gigas TaxID=29159 RepID=A0A8W8LPK2_MAGGI
MDYTINSAIYEDISSDEESFEEDLFLNKNNAEEFVSECEETSNIPTSEIPTPESSTPEIQTPESSTPEIQTSEKKNSMTIQLIKKTVSYEDGRTEVVKEINFSYTEEMREVSPYEFFYCLKLRPGRIVKSMKENENTDSNEASLLHQMDTEKFPSVPTHLTLHHMIVLLLFKVKNKYYKTTAHKKKNIFGISFQ